MGGGDGGGRAKGVNDPGDGDGRTTGRKNKKTPRVYGTTSRTTLTTGIDSGQAPPSV